MKKKPSLKQKLNKVKRKSIKTFESTEKGIKNGLNINRYNKFLFIFETILLIGVIDEFFETLIMGLELSIYSHILLLMLSIGTLFYFALMFIEKVAKGTITWLVRLNSNKILRFIVHVIILYIIFILYARVFFDTNISLVFNLGLSAG